jgi:hypothetical protein
MYLLGCWPDVGFPRFRRDPFVRGGAFDLGRAASHDGAAHVAFGYTKRLGPYDITAFAARYPTPRMIAAYASPWRSPSTAQHSLPGWRYPLPGPDSHRLDLASFLAH